MALIETEIRRSKPEEVPYKLSDGHGLYLLVNPAGSRLWRWKYRFDGKEKLMALGGYPETSLADVRECHATARKQLARGIDPIAEIEPKELVQMAQGIEACGASDMAKRILQIVGMVFRYTDQCQRAVRVASRNRAL